MFNLRTTVGLPSFMVMRKLLAQTLAQTTIATIICVMTTVQRNTSLVSPSLEKNNAIMREVLAFVHVMLSVKWLL